MKQTEQTSLMEKEQFRLERLQVFNWGTFAGRHNIPISPQGYLFAGRSGAGKSTLLDAFSAVLVPPKWVDFNAAARESERSGRDRNLVSYIRGAWAEQKSDTSGEVATQYLRKGTTWSALALSFRDDSGRTVTLVRLFWLRGQASGTTDVKRLHLIFEREFELKELEFFGDECNLDVRVLKQRFANDFIREDFQPYCERFSYLLGIENEQALRLLHKTQSAKNLGDLNSFLRDFMLEKPQTFDAADRLVSEFGELNAAHHAVMEAREQVHLLVPARERYEEMLGQTAEKEKLNQLQSKLKDYSDKRKATLLEETMAALHVRAESLDGEQRRLGELHENQKDLLSRLEAQHREAGGNQIEQWERDKAEKEKQRLERARKRDQAHEATRGLSKSLPTNAEEFAQLQNEARQELAQREDSQERGQQKVAEVLRDLGDAEAARTAASEEVDSLLRNSSNIPSWMLNLRHDIARAINVHPEALPFAGELMEVKKSESSWQGAIERVLGNFALSLLVNESHYSALAQYVDIRHLKGRLSYHVTKPHERSLREPAADSLVYKMHEKDCPQRDWLRAELRQAFDYACVDSHQALKRADRALTQQGQIKRSKTLHVKDDRYDINDRTRWVLGFDNKEKLALFKRQVSEQDARIQELLKQRTALFQQSRESEARSLACQRLQDLSWHEIDVQSLIESIASIEELIREASEGNAQLQQIGQRIQQQKAEVERASKALVEAKASYKATLEKLQEKEVELHTLEEQMLASTAPPLSAQDITSFEERFTSLNRTFNLANLAEATRDVQQELNREKEEFQRKINGSERAVEDTFAEFMRRWKMEGADVQAKVDHAPEFFAKLQRLETDGLPAFEDRFFELLKNQSQQNLTTLSVHLRQARNEIFNRMDLVNSSLSQVPFNQEGTTTSYLRIETNDRQLPEVQEFKRDLDQALSYSEMTDREVAEGRFSVLRSIVERLGSSEPDKKRWRESVLDVRLHVEFVGVESDKEGVEIERYCSGAGKSGGQRQKLATTCLAAALRYQLGGNEYGLPKYGAVILDEAFDKADNEFTALAMKIFTNFGFQMIVATPMKAVMAIEPFIGGACFVDIRDRNTSTALLIEYDDDQRRLRFTDRSLRQLTSEENKLENA